ncbi:talin-2-like isoform X2 [Hydractinia symbiolongicarpus]|uniref:talin-2-like isoform X2 n=1 Tax=Hydractinia symbiolongicarpus TaxID=13093 RepID=UPI00254CBC65|nr:talin-2-like isoform X2 [Hydractinia symbiolongicarpus]
MSSSLIVIKVHLEKLEISKTLQFEPTSTIQDVINLVRAKIPESAPKQNENFGVFYSDNNDQTKSQWCQNDRNLEFYGFTNGTELIYRDKHRYLKVKMLDGTIKTVLVDDSQTVAVVLETICDKVGITNVEEYSLFIEEGKDEKKEEFQSGTLSRRDKSMKTTTLQKVEERDKKKMDTLKRKLHTDDEVNWLGHDKTLREAGVEKNTLVVLRRKYMYEQSVNIKNPVEINLLYVQSRDGIIDGTYPCPLDEASKFAAYQIQIQYGDFDEGRYKSGYIDLKEFLPKEYGKKKEVEKKIKDEHKSIIGMDALNAKYKYIQLCQNLPTYGVTFFLVKEKMKGKNKLVPRLLGVNKESVLRVDEKTKQVLKTWPLTQVRRWAASPNSFTLDFGDYTEGYYSVQTPEGEQISQLIAGYIDIILKKRKAHDMYENDEDENSPILEEHVVPNKATVLQRQTNFAKNPTTGSVALPAVLRPGGQGPNTFEVGNMGDEQFSSTRGLTHSGHQQPPGQQAHIGNLSSGQKAIMKNIDDGNQKIKVVIEELCEQGPDLPDLNTDPQSMRWRDNQMEISKNNVASRLAAMSAATAAIISLTSGDPENFNYTAVGAGVSTITSNLEDLVRGIKMLAAFMDDDGDSKSLLDAAKDLANAFSSFLGALNPADDKQRQDLLNVAGKIGVASSSIMTAIGDPEADAEFQDLLLQLAKAVANATAALVLQAKNVTSAIDDTVAQDKIIDAAKDTAMNTSQLVACTKVLAPHINSPLCQDQMIEAAKLVATSVDAVGESCYAATEDPVHTKNVQDSSQAVTDALNNLLQHIRDGARIRPGGPFDTVCDDILNATDKLYNSMGNAGEMVKQAKVLAQATSKLVNGIKGDAEDEDDDDTQKRLLAAAKVLADATAKLVEAAKGAAKNPNDKNEQEKLKRAAEDLRVATNAAASNALKKKLILRLENAAKQAVASATQLISASKAAAPSNRNPASQQQLDDSGKVVNESSHDLIHNIRDSHNNPDSPAAQLGLITASQNFIPPASKLVANSKAAVPTVGDNAVAYQLNNSQKNTQNALNELRIAAEKAAEACGSLEIDNALAAVKELEVDCEQMRIAADEGQLQPFPDDNADDRALEVGASSKTVGATMAQLLTAAAQGNDSYTGIAARDTASALKVLANAVRGVAATSDEPKDQQAILKAAKVVMQESAKLIEEAKHALENPNDPSNQQKLAQVAKGVSHALNNVVNCLPGQRVVEDAIEEINRTSEVLSAPEIVFPETDEPFSQVQEKLNQSSLNLNAAANEVVHAAKGPTGQLAKASAKFSHSYQDFQHSGLTLAGQIKDKEAQDHLINDLRKTSTVSSKLLLASKSLAADPGAPNAKNLLAAAAKGVTDAINQLLNQALTAAPGQKECDSAVRNVEAMSHVLENPVEPVNEASFFECLDTATEKSQQLAQSMQDITTALKKEDAEHLAEAVGGASDAVCHLTESTAQAAYLVAIADPSSTAGRAGLVDQSQFAKARDAIREACDGLLNPNANQQQDKKKMYYRVLSAATVIAKHTAGLCNACKAASAKTDNPVAKRHFVQSAKDVANNTANLVKFIKVYAQDMSPRNRNHCQEATEPLLEAVDNLVTYASSPEFASVPAKISAQAKAAQYPLIMSGKSMVSSSTHYFTSTKTLAVNNKDQPTWQLFATHSRALADAMRKIVSAIKENAPGQQECDQAADTINRSINKIDQASLAAISNNLKPTTEDSLKGFEEKMMLTCAQLQEAIPNTVEYAKGAPEKIGHSVIKLANLIDPLADSAIGFSSKLPGGSEKQNELLNTAKTVCESAAQLVYATKDAGGNPKAVNYHPAVDEAGTDFIEAIKDLTQQLEETAGDTGAVTALVDSINRARTSINMFVSDYRDRGIAEAPIGTFVEHQGNMVKELKNIARDAQDMVGKANTKPKELGTISQDLCKNYNALTEDTKHAIRLSNQPEIAERLKVSVDTLGDSCAELVQCAGNVQSSPSDSYAKRELSDKAKNVSEKVSYVLATLQAGSVGTQECINAISTLAGIIGDLETTVMFAQAGTLNPEKEGETFGDHRETVLKTAKNLVEDTKNLVVAAQGSQEQLATSAQNVLGSMTKLVDNVKLGAAALGSEDMEAQVMLLMAAKDVATALTDLINSTKNSSGKSATDPAMETLKVSAKTMVTSVSSLLKTVRSVEDEASRGVRAIESTVDAVRQAVINLQVGDPEKTASPEDLIRATKGVTLATAKAVAAGHSGKQEDIVQAANVGRRYCTELLVVVKAAAFNAESESIRVATIVKGRDTAQAYCEVLDHVASVIVHPTPQKKQHLTVLSKKVAFSVGELVKSAEELKGADWVNPEDPNVIAENELLGAAASIEAAARKLAELKPRARPKQADESLNFEEQILEAAKSITAAAGALVKAATAAQRELVATGRVSSTNDPNYDGQWSQGLISAARMVVAAIGTLCETANAAVQGNASEERIIASAKGVQSSTAQLLLASRVKADANSKTQLQLQVAGNDVKRASDNLVKSASSKDEEFVVTLQVSQRKMGGIRQEREAENEVLRLERELEETRMRLAQQRKKAYQKK